MINPCKECIVDSICQITCFNFQEYLRHKLHQVVPVKEGPIKDSCLRHVSKRIRRITDGYEQILVSKTNRYILRATNRRIVSIVYLGPNHE